VELSHSEALRHYELEMKKPTLMNEVVMSHLSRVGRNEPCPCGSGKKYKKCHGA